MRETIPQVTPYLRLGGREWYLPNALRAFRHRNYRLFWAGQLVSLTGTWMQSTAQQWLVYRLTGSPLKLGAVAFAFSLPVMLFSLFAGVLVDRVDKRRLLVLLQSAMMLPAFALALLTFSGAVTYWHVVGLALLLGLANTFEMPTRQAFTVEMVGREDLMNAIALNSSVFNGARLVGPTVAGLLVARLGEAPAFLLNGLSFLAVIAGLLAMRLPPYSPPGHALRPLADFKEGLRYLAGDPVIRPLVLAVAIPSLFGFPFVQLVPVLAGEVLGLGADGFGVLISSIGLGALVGALSLAALGNYRPKGRLLTVAMFVFSGALVAVSLSRWQLLVMAALALAGWGTLTHLATGNTLIQLQVPDKLRGRVMSAYVWVVVGLAPVGSLILGWLAEALGVAVAVRLGALVCLAAAAAWLLFIPQLRRLE